MPDKGGIAVSRLTGDGLKHPLQHAACGKGAERKKIVKESKEINCHKAINSV